MRLLTFIENGAQRAGVESNGQVIDLSVQFPDTSVKALIAEDRLADVAEFVKTAGAGRPLAEVQLDLPVVDPAKIFCVGVNYMNRNAEYKDGSEAPPYPSLFVRSPVSFAAHGAKIIRPPESEQLDYEGEIVLVIGKQGRRISQADAMSHVAGLTIMNEGSIRDWLRHGKFNVTQGKNWDRSGGLGPWIETDLSKINPADMKIETRVNGEVRQSDTTASMAFPFPRIIEYISTFCTLLPGDLIATGTPTGSGGRFDPPKWLKPGDVVEVEVEGVGTLSNAVGDEADQQ
jgi:2-keto-4-pentenoate hydratase/2-oxohepta-3-ene-1,7-dioic acid hydratase in catechol pathway